MDCERDYVPWCRSWFGLGIKNMVFWTMTNTRGSVEHHRLRRSLWPSLGLRFGGLMLGVYWLDSMKATMDCFMDHWLRNYSWSSLVVGVWGVCQWKSISNFNGLSTVCVKDHGPWKCQWSSLKPRVFHGPIGGLM